MNYSMNISIDDAGLNTIYAAQQHVVVSKITTSLVQSSIAQSVLGTPVAWLAFQPVQNNTITWAETYDIYASTTISSAGSAITVNSRSGTAQSGVVYMFKDGRFSPMGDGSPGYYCVANQMQNGLNFGLFQQATVNSVPVSYPESIVPVLYNQTVSLQGSLTICIFLSNIQTGGTSLLQIPSTALTVQMSDHNTFANVDFDDKSNTFFLQQK